MVLQVKKAGEEEQPLHRIYHFSPRTFNHQRADVITLRDICTFHLPFFVIKERRYGNEDEEDLRWSLNKQASWLMNDASLLTWGLFINIHYTLIYPAVS